MIDRYSRNAQEMVPPGRTHEDWLEEQRQERESWKREDERVRAERLARLDAEQEAQFAPIKKREMHRWLAEHPGMTQDDFEKHAWPHLREVVIGDTREAMIAREIETQKVRMGGW